MIEEEARRLSDLAGVRPRVGLILGSGLGRLADAVEDAVVVPTSEIREYPVSTVSGHQGRLVIGMLEGTPVVVLQGRAHLYEGHSIQAVTYPIRLIHTLGAERLVVTNAAGGINRTFRPGTLMFIADHVNFTGIMPDVRDTRLPYDEAWLESAERAALDLGIRAARGVYVWTRGPSYETTAEIRFFSRIGADAVGMSTVPEVMQAAALGMKVLGISTITNPAAGLSAEQLSHEDVLRVGQRAGSDLEKLVRRVLAEIPSIRGGVDI